MIYYKYVNSKESLSSILENQALKVTSPNDFNDPFDCMFPNPKFSSKDIKRKIKNLIKKIPNFKKYRNYDMKNDIDNLVKEIIQDFKQLFNDLRNNEWKNIIGDTRILSLTSQKDNILMWSHYANSHKGYVLGFDFDNDLEIYKNIKQVRYGDNQIDKFANKILNLLLELLKNNFNEIIIQNKNSDDIINNKNVGQTILQIFQENIFEYLWIKKDIWKYEDEYRLVLSKNLNIIQNINGIECIPFKQDSLKEIIFGIKNDNDISLLKNFEIDIFKAYELNSKLNIKRI